MQAQTPKVPRLTSLGISYREHITLGLVVGPTKYPTLEPSFDPLESAYETTLLNYGDFFIMTAEWDASENVITGITMNGMRTSLREPGKVDLRFEIPEVGESDIAVQLFGGIGNMYTVKVIRIRESGVLDMNDNFVVTSADGILIARYLLGVKEGMGLTAGQTGNDDMVVAFLTARGDLDVDERAGVDYRDGILIARYLLGLRGAVLGAGGMSDEPQAAAERIQRLLPQP